MATLIGFSRLYLFVHFPTDVLCGAFLGSLIAINVFLIGNKIIDTRKKKKVKSTFIGDVEVIEEE